jgi:hypothetical protein
VESASDFATSMPSAAIRFFDYDAGRRELLLGYAGGGEYVYEGVSPAEYAGLKAARSKGGYVNAVIKRHPFRRSDGAGGARRTWVED